MKTKVRSQVIELSNRSPVSYRRFSDKVWQRAIVFSSDRTHLISLVFFFQTFYRVLFSVNMAGIEIIDLDKYYGPSNTAV